MPRGFFVANCTWCKGFAFWGPWGVRQGGVGKTRLLVGTTWRVSQVMVAGAGPGSAGGRVLRSGTSVCCGVRVAAREQGEVVGGGSGQHRGGVAKKVRRTSARPSFISRWSPPKLWAPPQPPPHMGCPRSLLLSLLAWAAHAAQGLGAASSAEAQEQSGLRKHPAGPSLARQWHSPGMRSAGPAWAPAAGGGGVCRAGGGILAWPAVPGPPTLFLSLWPSGPGPCSPNVSETEVSEGKTLDTPPPPPGVLPDHLELRFLIGAPAGRVGTADTASDVQPRVLHTSLCDRHGHRPYS